MEEARASALLQEGLKVPDAAVTKGFCPTEMAKIKQLSAHMLHIHRPSLSPKLCASQRLAQTLAQGTMAPGVY